MKPGNFLSMLRILSLLGFTIFFGLSVHLGLNIFSFNASDDALTGMTPLTGEYDDIEPTYSEDELSVTVLEERQNMIMDECSRAHRNSADCYNLVRSIVSVVSRDEDHQSEFGTGLIPLRDSQTDLEPDELLETEDNVREATRYLMRLYDTYNGDLAFTSMAYIAGRAISNNIMYDFINREDGQSITLSVMLDSLSSSYEQMEDDIDPALSLEEMSQYYVDILSAFNFWAEQPMADSNIDDMMYDRGTYSIYPSFSTQIEYDLTYMEDIRSILSEYAENPPSTIPSYISGDTEDSELSFNGLLAFLINENDEEDYEVSAEDEDSEFSMDGMTWKQGMCNPVLDDFYAVVDRFMQCIEMEGDCHCDFSEVYFDYEDYNLHIEIEDVETDSDIDKEKISFRLTGSEDENDDVLREESYVSYLEGSIDRRVSLYAENEGGGVVGDDYFTYRNSERGLHLLSIEAHPTLLREESEEGVEIKAITVQRDDYDFGEACPMEQEYEHICIESETAYAYDEFYDGYTPIEHQFTFAQNPLEFRDEDYETDLEELSEKTIEIGSEDDGEDQQKTVSISPGADCENNERCTENIILGKPASYSNSREMIVLHNLPYGTSSDAIEEYEESLSSDTEYENTLDESHYSTHYLIEGGLNQHTKLAREDAVLRSSGPFDSRSIHIGLIPSSLVRTDSFDDDYIVEISAKLAEIMIRNDIDPESIFVSEELDPSEMLGGDLDEFFEENEFGSSGDREEIPVEEIKDTVSHIIAEYNDD